MTFLAYHLMGNILQNMGRDSQAEKYFVMAEEIARELGEGAPRSEAPSSLLAEALIFKMNIGDRGEMEVEGVSFSWECVSERPLIVRIKGLLSAEECEHIIDRAEPKLQRSFAMGVGGATNPSSSAYRNSLNTWLAVDGALSRIQARIAAVSGIPLRYIAQKSEDLQVVKYDIGGSSFRVHHDSSSFQPRLMTALIYLSSSESTDTLPQHSSGETWFPYTGERRRHFDESVPSMEAAIRGAQLLERRWFSDETPSEFSSDKGEELIMGMGSELSVRPIRGDAVLFLNHLADGSIDNAAVHAGLPTSAHTTKWVANYWVHYDPKLFAELSA
jgi:hypothetical protein